MFSFFKRNRDVQTFPSKKLQKVINNAISFLNKSPSHRLPLKEKFLGCGVYVLYYNGIFYDNLVGEGCDWYFTTHPIYVGKAVPTGWRNGRTSKKKSSHNLWKRIQEHSVNISQASNLNLDDFCCKYVVLDGDLISTLEAKLIRDLKPLWNVCISGFGNHHPGMTRFNQARPDWDVLHPGRPWVEKMLGGSNNCEEIIASVKRFLSEQ